MLGVSMCHCSHVPALAAVQGSGDVIHPLLQSSALLEVVLGGRREEGKLAELSRSDTLKDTGQWQKLVFFISSKVYNLLSHKAGRYSLVRISLH